MALSMRSFICTAPNPWRYPAKDRSGRLEQLEEPDLGKLISKLTKPGAAASPLNRRHGLKRKESKMTTCI